MDNRTEILDLRTALQVLRGEEGQLIETDVPVDTMAELSGVYRYVGAGGTVKRPTGVNGPAMVFHNLKGFPEASEYLILPPACEIYSMQSFLNSPNFANGADS